MKSYPAVLSILIAFVSLSFVLSDDGRAGRTGSPGETTCNTSGCHTGNALNAAGGSITISAPGLTGWQYVPGQTYAIEVTISRPGFNLYGIGFEALKSDGSNAGTIVVTNSAETHIKNAVIGVNTRANLVHQLNGGTSPGSHTFSFNWIAPAAGVGNVTFYTAGNAANANGSTSGDFIYNTSQVVTPSTTSLEESMALSGIISPNPVFKRFRWVFSFPLTTAWSFSLYSSQGNKMSLSIGQITEGKQSVDFELPESIPAGIYIISAETPGNRITRRILVF